METMRQRMFAAMALAVLATPSGAADWVLGPGSSDFDAGSEAAVAVEVHGRPLWSLGGVEIGGAAGVVADGDGSVWIGAGLSALLDLGPRWFVEASVMPGVYDEGSAATDLGHGIEFRSLIGVGYTLNAATRLSLGFDHKSNAGLGARNPGVNTLSLRLRRTF